jgi:hypothetical protein
MSRVSYAAIVNSRGRTGPRTPKQLRGGIGEPAFAGHLETGYHVWLPLTARYRWPTERGL